MATTALIGVVVKPQDRGRLIEPNFELLGKDIHTELREPEFHVTEIEETTKIISIYHHYDGYPEELGETLLNEFNDYEKALNIMSFGDASSINDDSAKFYNSWRAGEPWEYTSHRQFESEQDFEEAIENYYYLFNDGKWFVKKYEGEDWVELVKVLDGEADI